MKTKDNLLEKRFKISDRKKIFVRWRWEKDNVLITYCNKYADRGIITLDPISSFVKARSFIPSSSKIFLVIYKPNVLSFPPEYANSP